MADRQIQKAGDNSSQYQVAGDLVIGLTEDRAREIALSTARSVMSEYTDEAKETGFQRVEQFDEKLVFALSSEAQLAIFRDPAFQLLLKKAQLSAASSERINDHDVLVKLLSDRARTDPGCPLP